MSIPQAGQRIRRTIDLIVDDVTATPYGYRVDAHYGDDYPADLDNTTFIRLDHGGLPLAGTIEIIVPVPAEPPVGSVIVGIGYMSRRLRSCGRMEGGWYLDGGNGVNRGGWADGAHVRTWNNTSVLGQFRTVISAIGPDGQDLDRTSWGVAP